MLYKINEAQRKQMQEELDSIIDYVNAAGLSEGNALPDLKLELTDVEETEGYMKETVTTIGTEFAEDADASKPFTVEERFHNVKVYDDNTGDESIDRKEWQPSAVRRYIRYRKEGFGPESSCSYTLAQYCTGDDYIRRRIKCMDMIDKIHIEQEARNG